MKKIVVAMATYNGGRYLIDQIESIFNQTLKVDKLIISDDNSNDNTSKIINKLIFDGLPIEFYKNNSNLGYGLNFMKCINFCDGDYIFLSDQDDVWFPNKVEVMMKNIEKYPNYLCWMHDCSITNSELKCIIRSKLKNLKDYGFTKDSFVMGACMVLKREVKNYIYPYPSNIKDYGHDDWIAWVMRSTNNLKVINESLIFYRRHSTITSKGNFNYPSKRNHIKSLIYRFIDTFKNFKKTKKQNNKNKNRNFLWSKLSTKNIKFSDYKIRDSHSLKTQKIALYLNKNNHFKRIIQIHRLKKSGYYKFRSNWLSIFIDLFFS